MVSCLCQPIIYFCSDLLEAPSSAVCVCQGHTRTSLEWTSASPCPFPLKCPQGCNLCSPLCSPCCPKDSSPRAQPGKSEAQLVLLCVGPPGCDTILHLPDQQNGQHTTMEEFTITNLNMRLTGAGAKPCI